VKDLARHRGASWEAWLEAKGFAWAATNRRMPKAGFPPPEWPEDPLMPNLGVSQINPEYLFFFATAIRNWYSVEPGLCGRRERTE